jgi:peptidoglycan/LPS O-acetylase OafA/YrhL
MTAKAVFSTARKGRATAPSNPLGMEQYYAPLDGVRGLAIFAVFALHYGGGRHLGNPLQRFIGEIVFRGWMGVDLFFVLSGYLITRILLHSVGDRRYYSTFYARRTLRIFPLYYGVLLGLLALTPWLGLHWKALHLAYPLYLQNIVAITHPGQTEYISASITLGAFWSLAVEEQFYLIWPWLIKSYSGASRRAVGLFVVALAGPPLIRLIVLHWGSLMACYRLLPCRVDSLACGALLALLAAKNKLMFVPKWVPYLLFGGCAIIIGYLSYSDATVNLLSTVGLSFIAVGCTAMVWLALWPASLVARSLSLAPLRFLGRYSYGIYVYHELVHKTLQLRLLPVLVRLTKSISIGSMLFFVLALTFNLAVAILSYHCFEIHFLRLNRYFRLRSERDLQLSAAPATGATSTVTEGRATETSSAPRKSDQFFPSQAGSAGEVAAN